MDMTIQWNLDCSSLRSHLLTAATIVVFRVLTEAVISHTIKGDLLLTLRRTGELWGWKNHHRKKEMLAMKINGSALLIIEPNEC